jgi:enterochelin esterase-like enzyme
MLLRIAIMTSPKEFYFTLFLFFRLSIALLLLLTGVSACAPMDTVASSLVPTPSLSSPVLPTETLVSPPTQFSVTPEPSSTPDCRTQAGRMVSGSLPSKILPKPLAFHIYLPACYDQNPDAHYPVLYLLHGLMYTDDQWQRLGAPAAADQLIAAGGPEFIMVMPYDRSTAQPSLDPFDKALVQELIPYVDSTYRTRTERSYRAIGGLSRGGGWAIHIVLNYPDLFGAMGGHSPAIFAEEDSYIPIWLKKIPVENMPLIALDIGDSDRALPSVIEFEALLTKSNIPHEWHLFRGYHDEDYWSSHTEAYLKWYTDNWK